jgi:hypothetical protein
LLQWPTDHSVYFSVLICLNIFCSFFHCLLLVLIHCDLIKHRKLIQFPCGKGFFFGCLICLVSIISSRLEKISSIIILSISYMHLTCTFSPMYMTLNLSLSGVPDLLYILFILSSYFYLSLSKCSGSSTLSSSLDSLSST